VRLVTSRGSDLRRLGDGLAKFSGGGLFFPRLLCGIYLTFFMFFSANLLPGQLAGFFLLKIYFFANIMLLAGFANIFITS